MATPSVFLPGESPWTKEPAGLQPMGLQRFKSLTHFELSFLYEVGQGSSYYFACCCPVFPTPFIEKTTFSSIACSWPLHHKLI